MERMKSYGINYLYTSQNSNWLDDVDLSYTHNEVLGLADTWIYDRTLNADKSAVLSSVLNNREYRPIETTTDQFSLKLRTLPFNLEKAGEHRLSWYSNFIKQDYQSSAIDIYEPGSYLSTHTKYSFPDAKKDIFNISLIDDIYFSDRFKANIGVRYDNYKYSPYYQNSEEHTLNATTCTNTLVGKWLSDSAYCNSYREEAGLTDAHMAEFSHWNTGTAARNAWLAENTGKYTGLKKTKFDHLTWSGALDYALIQDKLNVRYKIGTGFLAPTVTQIYNHFSFNGASQVPNYNLKPETSLNQELEFDWKVQENINLILGGYYTKYDDFIHTKYWEGSRNNPNTQGCTRGTCLQSVNLDEAKVYGVKLGINADLSSYLNSKGKFNVFANFHTAKDSALIETDYNGKLKINTLAAVPTSLLLGGTYASPDDRWSLNTRINWIKRKKAEDAKNLETEETVTTTTGCPKYITDYYGFCPAWAVDTVRNYTYNEVVKSYDQIHRSKDVMLFDVFGSVKLGRNKNWIVNAGVYNITDVQYIPWETLRQFATTSVNNMVDKDGYGFNRYTAPGRNYTVSLTYEF